MSNNKKISIAELVYIIYFAVMFGAKACGLYEGMTIYNISILAGMLLFGCKVLCTEHTIFEYTVIAMLLLMCLLVYRNTGEKGLLFYMTLMLGMKGVSLLRMEKWAATIVGLCFTALTFLSITGIINGKFTTSANRFFGGEMLRHYLGYPNCNVTHTTFVILMMLIVLAIGYRGKKDLIITCVFLYMINIYVYLYTLSTTGLIASTVFIVALLWAYRRDTIGKYDSILLGLLYPFCMFISIGLPLLIKGDLFWKLDSILHNRMNYPHYWLTHEPVTLFGVRFGEAPNPDYYIDSSFLYSFLQIGVIPCIILAAMMLGMIYNLIKQNRRTEVAIFVALCVLGLSDPFFYNLAYKNILFLFIGDMFFGWTRQVEKKLPDFFGKTIQIFPVGSREVAYGNRFFYKIWVRACEYLDGVISINGIRHIVIFAVLSLVIYGMSYFMISPGSVVGTVDTIDEWEYVRMMLSLGVWISAVVVLIVSGVEIKKRNHENNYKN